MNGYNACAKLCQGGKAPDCMIHLEKVEPWQEAVWHKHDVIIGPMGRGNPLGIPMRGHKRRK